MVHLLQFCDRSGPAGSILRFLRFAAGAALLAITLGSLTACAGQARVAGIADETPVILQTRQVEEVTVSVGILSDEQAIARFGVDLSSGDMQALWVRIENDSPQRLWFLVAALDPAYYSPDEAAFMFRAAGSDSDAEQLRQRFRDSAMRLMLEPGSVNEGHILVPYTEGGRFVNVELVGHERRMRFGFAVLLPDGDFDYERLNPERIYADQGLPELGVDELRASLEGLPCCTSNADGDRPGDPLNLVIIGELDDVLVALARSGWSFTHRITFRTVRRELGAAIGGEPYPVAPVSPLYLFGRRHDFALQRARTSIAQRNHLRLWLAPFTFEGESVWVGQISRDIGIKLTGKSATLTTHVIDPAVDEAREYLLQSLLVHHAVRRFGFVRAFEPTPRDVPRLNLTDDQYFSDGLRLVVMLARDPLAPQRARNLHWEEAVGPIAPLQDGAAGGP